MLIRSFRQSDLPQLIDLTIATFRPFYEDYFRPLVGEEVFEHQHGHWEQDYRDDLPTLHDPSIERYVAVAEIDGAVAGYVAWRPDERPRSGQIYMLAVSATYRRQAVGRGLCEHALRAMKAVGIQFVGIGTGDDAFHAAARGLYEALGFTKIPIAGYLKKL